jgi:queuosine precursor transporter
LMLGVLGIAVRLGRTALSSAVALCGVMANLFVVKQVVLFGLHVTCSDVYAIGGMLGLNLLQEVYGKDCAQETSVVALFLLLCFAGMAEMQLLYQPSGEDWAHSSFVTILSSSPRIIAASCFVYFIVQRIDIVWFSFLKKIISSFSARLFSSLLLSQALDTVLFSFMGLYGLVSSIWDIILVSFAIKCALIASASPLASFLKRFVRSAA